MASIDEFYTDYDSDDRSISTNALKDIRVGSQIHQELNIRYAIFKIRARIRKHRMNVNEKKYQRRVWESFT